MEERRAAVPAVEVRDPVIYATPKGQRLPLTLFLPKTSADPPPRPCVLLIHGGAWMAGTRHQLRWYGRKLAERGYVAASISYRKMPRHRFPTCLHDAKSAVRWLRQHAQELNLDPERLAVCGNSAGGHLAAMLAATDGVASFEGSENRGGSSAVQAAVCIYGAMDLRHFQTPKTWIGIAGISGRVIERFIGAQYKDGQEPFDLASPITHLSRRTAPTLFIHGDKDNMVPVEHSRLCCDKLRGCGVASEFVCVPNRGHGFDHIFPRDRRHIFRQILAFLDQHLAKLDTPLKRAAEG